MINRLLLSVLMCAAFLAGNLFAQGPPPTPTNLLAERVPNALATVKLAWQAPNGPWHYRVYRSVNDTLGFSPIGMTGQRTFYDHMLAPGNTYYYYVTSFVNGAESPRSNIAHASIGPPGNVHRGAIAGTVIDDSTALPIRNVLMRFYRVLSPSMHAPFARTDSLGRYHAVLDTGTYLVKAEPPWGSPWLPEWYDNVPHPSQATPVAVAESTVVTVNVGLARRVPPTYAYVSGTVTDTNGTPLRHASVAIIRTIQEMNFLFASTGMMPGMGEEIAEIEGVGHTRGVIWRGFTDSLGNYRARVIADRSYIAMASKFGYLPEFFDNKPTPQEADIIHVTGDTSGIDFSLSVNPLLQNSISGVVQDSLNNGVASRIILLPLRMNTTHRHIRFGHTDSNGVYHIANLRAGDYFVLAMPFAGFAPAFYKQNACGVMGWQNADTVQVAGDITGINICVVPINTGGLARVSGTIRTSGGLALEGVTILAMTPTGAVVGYGLTDNLGRYSLDAVPSGPVAVVVDREGYAPVQGQVNIPSGTYTVSNVNFALSPMSTTSAGETAVIPDAYALHQNYPNPFNPSTTITYSLPVASQVTVKIYNLLGQEIATLVNGEIAAGSHEVVWNGRDDAGRVMASGLYFYRMKASSVTGGVNFETMKKMVLLK